MSGFFVKVTSAPKPKTKDVQTIAYLYAFILVVFVLAQLFTYDKFLSLLNSFSLPGGTSIPYLLAFVLVVSEVFALPFLLRMDLSPLMRGVSIVLGWLVSIAWLKLSLWLVLTSNVVTNVGFLGTAVQLPPGWWAVFISVALVILAIWTSWGLWPFAVQRKKQGKTK